MNGFHRLSLTLFPILTLGIFEPVQADLPPITANELACHRDRVSTDDSKAPFRSVELPATLVSHKCDGDPEPEAKQELQPSIEHECVELRVLNAELIARLEMTQAILELQNHYTDQIVSLERQNAKLAIESAELRVKNEVNEKITAGLIERTELSAKLTAAHDWISSRTAYEASIPLQVQPSAFVANPTYEETIAAIQEDISNLRRQLPLIKRTPVPFAVSNSISHENGYVPIGGKPATAKFATGQCPSTEEVDVPCREAAAKTPQAR